jgi:hypothetical protein
VIIDTHAHVHPDPGGLGPKQDASVEKFLATFDASPLDKIVLLPIEPVIPTDFVLGVAEQRPGKILPYGSVDPHAGNAAIEAFERQVESGKIHGLKFHPRRQNLGQAQFPMVRELTQRAAGHGLPVLMDSFPYGRGALRDTSLEWVEALAEAAPKADLIIAHMGGIRILEALIVARTSYTIHLDLSLIYSVYRGTHLEQDIFYAIRRIGADRCLYGSDYPDVDLRTSYEDLRAAVDAHGFSDSEQDAIFGGNARRLLRLEKD